MHPHATVDPTAAWIDQPWEKRRYSGGTIGIVHWDTTGDVHHVAVEVHPGTADLFLAAPIFYRAAMEERETGTHVLEHGCDRWTCRDYIVLQGRASATREAAVAVAEGRFPQPEKEAIDDPRIVPPKPVEPTTRAFQTNRIFQVEGGAAGRADIVRQFFAETGASIEGVETDEERAERLNPRPGPDGWTRYESGTAPSEATDETPDQPTAPMAPADYELPTSLEGRPPTPHERLLLDKIGIAGRPTIVAERGDHRPLNAEQWAYVREQATGGSTSGIGVRSGIVLHVATSPSGEVIEVGLIDGHAEGRCEQCAALPGYMHAVGCPTGGQP